MKGIRRIPATVAFISRLWTSAFDKHKCLFQFSNYSFTKKKRYHSVLHATENTQQNPNDQLCPSGFTPRWESWYGPFLTFFSLLVSISPLSSSHPSLSLCFHTFSLCLPGRILCRFVTTECSEGAIACVCVWVCVRMHTTTLGCALPCLLSHFVRLDLKNVCTQASVN